MGSIQRPILSVLLTLWVLTSTGCETAPKDTRTPTHSVMRVTNHVGGAHYRTMILDSLWYQTFSNTLLILDPQTIQPVATLELGTFGECGPAIDLAFMGDGLFVLLEDDQVVQVSIDDPMDPHIVDRRSAAQLGILPRRLNVVSENGEDVLFACGEGGAVRVDGGPVLLAGMGDVQSIAVGSMGLVGTIGRRVYSAEDQRYVGAASELYALPDDDADGLLFVQHGDAGGLIGIMDSDIRERHARDFTTAVGGTVHRVRCFDGSIWIVTDEQILAYTPDADELKLRDVFRVRGARDVDMIRENYLAVAGTFGRSIYRIRDDSNGKGDTFVRAHREPGQLRYAISDRLQVLAGTPQQGTWLYQIGSEASLMDKVLSQEPALSRDAVTDDGTATLSADGMTLSVKTKAADLSWEHPKQQRLHCVIAVESRFWVGHDSGVTILKVRQPTPEEIEIAAKNELDPPQPELQVDGNVWLHGPVRYLFALLTNRGATYVATYSGFGTIEFIEEPIPAPEL